MASKCGRPSLGSLYIFHTFINQNLSFVLLLLFSGVSMKNVMQKVDCTQTHLYKSYEKQSFKPWKVHKQMNDCDLFLGFWFHPFIFTRFFSLKKISKKNVHEGITYPCRQCDYAATTAAHLKNHKKSCHEGVRYPYEQHNMLLIQFANSNSTNRINMKV